MRSRLALDATARTFSEDGHLHISKSHISKACVNPYYGREIPGYESLGLSPDRIYQMFRDPEELAKGADTFARLPILSQHQPIDAINHPDQLVVGAIGSDIAFNYPYLDADISFWKNSAIAGIETNTVRELSAAYRYVPVMTSGTYKGEFYDGIMTQIRGNHLALVEAGRAGSDVLAADSKLETKHMTRLGNALAVSLAALSPVLAQDSALSKLVGDARKKTFNKGETVAKLVAMDATLTPEKLNPVIDSLVAMDADDAPEPKKPVDKPAEDEDDEDEKEKKRKEKEEMAADTAATLATFKRGLLDADEARRAVRPIVGEVVTQDSAIEIYGFALDEMKVPHAEVKELAGKKAIFNMAIMARDAHSQSAPVAMDAASESAVAAQFPDAFRFRNA